MRYDIVLTLVFMVFKLLFHTFFGLTTAKVSENVLRHIDSQWAITHSSLWMKQKCTAYKRMEFQK